MIPTVVLDLSADAAGVPGMGEREVKDKARYVERLRALTAEMSSLALVYLTIDLGAGGGPPWSAEEFREALGSDVVTVSMLPACPGVRGSW